MIWIYTIWLLLIAFEILRNWSIMEVANKRPTYWYSNLLRVTAGAIFWLLTGLFHVLSFWQWMGMLPMMVLTFWFIFDYGLVCFRNFMNKVLETKRDPIVFYYLNPNGSLIDRLQCKYPHPFPWFWWKLLLMITGIYIFHSGLDTIWVIKY